MGNQCCAATSDDTKEIVAQHTDFTVEQELNQHQKTQIEAKAKQQNQLKTNFYGNAGISCSKTMTTEKNSKIQSVIEDYKSKVIKNDQLLEKIKEQSVQEEITRKQIDSKAKSQKCLSTNQIIDLQASSYLQNVFEKLQDG